MKRINRLFLFAAFMILGATSAHAAEMYYNRLSTGDKTIPAGTYGDIVVPVGGYKATQFPSALGTISQATGDYDGAYAGIVALFGGNKDLMTHTVSGWFKVPKKESGETTVYLAKTENYVKASHYGYGVRINADGYLVIGKLYGQDGWQGADYFASTGKVPQDTWFYLTVSVKVDHATRTAAARVFANGVEIEMPAGKTFAVNYNGNAYCSHFKVGDNVECAGLRVDDTAVTDPTTMKAWATQERYFVRGGPEHEMPYVSMGYDITNDTTGTFLTYDSQLAFPGYTLEDVLAHDFFGRLTGGNIKSYKAGYEGGLQIGRHVQAWTNDQSKLEKVLFTVNGRKTSTYAKVVTVLLTNGVNGVYAVVPTSGARNSSSAAEGDMFASFDADGSILLTGSTGTLATSDTADGYGCRGLTMTRYIPSDKPVLAFKNTTVDAIKHHTFTGYSTGRSMSNGYTSIPMASYNEKVTEESEGVATKLRAEMQVDDGGYCKCVVVEFTNGNGGVYVKALASRSVTGSGKVGYKFVNDNGSYNGTSRAFARDFSANGYGVFALKAYAPQPITTAYWTNAGGDDDIANAANWACTNAANVEVAGALPTADSTVYLTGNDIGIQITSDVTWGSVNVNGTLGKDCNWTGLGTTPIMYGSTIDINGYNLTLANVFTGTVTDTTEDTTKPGSLTLTVAHDVTLENTTLALTGNLKFIKNGEGALNLSKASQTYTGGTLIAAGTLKLPGVLSASEYLGTNGSALTIGKDGTFNMNGCYGMNLYPITLQGGKIRNERVSQTTYDNGGIGDVTLTTDSTLEITVTTLFNRSKTLNLGGHTLNVTRPGDDRSYVAFDSAYTITNGTLVIGENVSLNTRNSEVNLSDATLVVNGRWLQKNNSFNVLNLEANMSGVEEPGSATVTGVFKTDGRYTNVTLQDGATLDLTGNASALSTTSSYSGHVLSFASGATITVDIYGRELDNCTQVVAWNTKPENVTFKWDSETEKAGKKLVVASTGIYHGEIITTAHWTGAADDGDPTNPQNWACTNSVGVVSTGVVPTADTTVYFTGNAINAQITSAPNWKEVSITGKLGADCDWTGLAETTIANGSTIDVNGHNLTLNRVFAGTITDMATTGDPGSLTLTVAQDVTLENKALALTGKVKLVKEGAGTFLTHKTQSYTGGNVVNAGVLKLPAETSGRYYVGADGSTITVGPNATFNMNGCYDLNVYPITLAGGTLRSERVNQTAYKNGGLGDVTLTADSSMYIDTHTIFHKSAGATLNLGGHTLTVTGSDKYCSFSYEGHAYTIRNGTLVISTGAQLNTRVAEVNLTDASIVIEANGKWLHGNADFTVKNLTMENDTGSARIVYVTGAFKSVNGAFKYVELKNGATIDLTENAGVLETAGKNFTFEASATITVDIHGRALAKGTQLVAWTAIPANVTFQWDAATLASEHETLTLTDEGLFYGISDVADAYWTNAAGDGDVDNWQNWACTNSSGVAVAKGLPISSSVIHLPQYIRFQVPTGKAIACSKIQLKANAMLSEDCDWRGLGVVTVVPSGTSPLFLGGHTLRTAGLATEDSAELQVVNAHDALSQLVFDIPSGQTYENDHLAILQNIQVVKEGAGTFVAKKASQTYTGGTVVAEGTVKTGIQGTNGPFGAGSVANKKLITVESGATFDLNGQTSHTVYRFILNGGTLTNTASDMGKTTGFGSLTLGADSYLAATRSTSGWCGHTIDLGGHTLNVSIGSGKRLYLSGDSDDEPVMYKAGKVVVSSGGWLNFYKGKVNAKSVDFDINAALAVEVEVDVHDYTSRYAQNYNTGTAALNVYGTFKPVSSYWYGCTMQGGSTIDLTARSGTWSLTSSFTGGSKTVQFADGALVWVDLTGRTDLKKGDKIIAWTTKPNAKLKVIPETMGVVMRDDGLYLGIEEGVPVVDASGKGSITIPTEWVTAHATGETPEEQYASLTAPRETGNKITLRDNYVLGLNPDEATSIPVIHPIQSSNPDVVVLNVGGLDMHPESGAIVKYQLMEKASLDGEYVAGSVQESDTFEAGLPASGVRYYQVNVIVTTPEAGEEETAAQVMINGKAYTSFAEAVADAEEGDTLVVMEDLSTSGTINVPTSMTLDLNELAVEGTINVKSGATLTVVGVGEFDGPIHVEDGGTLDWKNGTHKE